jgi:hypothetical protein
MELVEENRKLHCTYGMELRLEGGLIWGDPAYILCILAISCTAHGQYICTACICNRKPAPCFNLSSRQFCFFNFHDWWTVAVPVWWPSIYLSIYCVCRQQVTTTIVASSFDPIPIKRDRATAAGFHHR